MRYAWIGRHKKQWPITLQCAVLDVSASGYFEYQRRKGSVPSATLGKRISGEALLTPTSRQPMLAAKADTAGREFGKSCVQTASR